MKHLYHLRCHKWVDMSSLRKDFIGSSNPISQGVFSHSMGVRRSHTLVIFGGYSGHMRSHLLAYVLPSAVLSDQHLLNTCSRHKSVESCVSNLVCGWCTDTNSCVERKNSKNCNSFVSETCPGFCSALSDCLSCLIWGQSGSLENIISDRQDPFPPVACTWCVQDSKCHSGDDTLSNCSSSTNGSAGGTAGSVSGWWGPGVTDIQALEECYIKDSPPGLVSIKYRHPINYSQPDDVTFLRQASEEILFRSEVQNTNTIEENIVKFMGFLHPLDAKPLSKRIAQLQLRICSTSSTAVLKLSNDSTYKNFEVVANHNPKPSLFCSDVRRSPGMPLFPDTSEGHKYMFDFTVKVPAYLNESSTVQLTWTAFSVDFEVIDAKHLELYKNGSCSDHSNCLSCLTDALCGWCESTRTCYPKTGYPQVLCQKNGRDSFLVTHPDNCSVCSDYIYCEKCAQIPTCEWLVESAICVRRGRFISSVRSPENCPTPCPQRSSCVSCLGDPGLCAWCEETQTCFLFSTYTSSYAFGKCRDWVDENRSMIGTDLCRNCSRHSQCSSCVRDLTCGWCSSSDHRAEGACTDGDFSGPFSGSCQNHLKNASLQGPLWSYSNCPDLEECLWNMHDCHENATCHNTPDSYTCECNIGFEGDGRNCIRACSVKCVHGYCSNSPLYECICELGWTGLDCSVNCGCNNHSTCNTGIGVCDSCQNWTMGSYCEKCKPGSYGNATTLAGCKKCECNDHGSIDLGVCNSTTGVCYCMNNTKAPNCAQCEEGYYGDPRNGGVCFEECHPRKVITNALSGRFGSPSLSSMAQDCLWLLTVHSALDMQSLLGPMQSTSSFLQLTIHSDVHIPCPHNHVYVYDGLPNFVASGHPNVLLGAFCGTNLSHPIVATASSGYLTVHFKRGAPGHGFNASYERLVEEESVGNIMCPRNCSASSGQGRCDELYNVCLCEAGFGGDDCSTKLSLHHLSWSMLYSTLKNNVANLSSNLLDQMPVPRIGHSLVTVNRHLMLFGGYSSTDGDLNDLFQYNVTSNQWSKIVAEYNPSPRHFHAAAASVNGSMYVFGGLRELKPEHWGALGDFWEFTPDQVWVQLPEITVSSGVISMAGATLTAISASQLILLGGFSPSYGFFEKVMEFDTESKQWTRINCSGAQPLGLYGHSSVYHANTESIYVFGGVAYIYDRVSPSDYLYSFHYPSRKWSRLPPDKKVNKPQTRPLPRYFHTSVVTENFLIVIGGRGTSTINQSSQPFAYVFSCNLWIPLTEGAIEVVGSPPKPFVGAAASTSGRDFYFFGGMDGQLLKLSAPEDMCRLFTVSRMGCIQQTGCTYCSLTENGMNQTFCFSQANYSQSKCYNPRESVKYQTTVNCNAEWIEKRDCQQYTTCTDCVASWPAFKGAKQVCKWCSNCRSGRCVPLETDCDKVNDCSIKRKVITDPSTCIVHLCGASDCEKCEALKICIWTRQAQRSTGHLHTLNQIPKFNWSCVMKDIQTAVSFEIASSPPSKCPVGCSENTDCPSCLKSLGGEGGWHHCVWSETLKTCMSPTAELLRCEDGSCGPVVHGNASSSCSVPCWHHAQAAHCLAHAGCGWCAFTGENGRGLCMDGGILGPTGGSCKENNVMLNGVVMPSKTQKWFHESTGPPMWTYLTKPPENECLNGHDTCDKTHEDCVDTLDGFECHCKPGYKMEAGKRCTPTCNQGCLNGTCIQPDVCQCNFGFVGLNCSIMCKCNGHSNCPGPDKLEECTQCVNNTMGSQCQKCKPLFVGNPINGGSCISCSEYCHTHSNVCLALDLANTTASFNQSYLAEIIEHLKEGPIDEAVCIDCKNNTEGNRCNQCINGYFKAGERLEDGCRPCECNGHGDSCNPLNGENCNCQNNTENDRQCAQKNMKNMLHMTPCWQLQCSKCTEYFLGSPSRGHQCYRHMYLDKEYCFDPTTQGECNRTPIPLVRGQTVFFAVQPRYMNVDIRIFVDITRGGVDFFLSAKEDTFIVEVERHSGLHKIYIDEKYHASETQRRRRDARRRDVDESSNSSTGGLSPKIGDAQGLTTYIDVRKWEDFLLVRNLRNRLVVTIPQEVHDLRTTRFYMILRGTEEQTFGSLFFRQDQTRIDLFVFFSVFFSCFFLFLAVCVVGWKVKQAFDVRRARRLHAAEMKHMASRPFARVLTVIEDEDDPPDPFFSSPRKKRHHGGKGSPKPPADEVPAAVRALAVEPLSDGFGAIATILIQLPGNSLVRMSLASSLITSRHYYGYGLRAAMRRRTSHANV